MLDETVYRCIDASCARSLPRRVNFCPYCGMAQHAGAGEAAQRAGRDATPAVALEKPVPVASPPVRQPAAGAATAMAEPVATRWGASPRADSAGATAAPPAPAAAPPPAASRAQHSAAAPPAAAPRAPARPPEREPVRLRWWLLALTVLWLVWIKERPAPNRIDARIDHAIALATDCKARDAQSELIALRSSGATEEQLLRVQQALNEAAAACSRSRQRGRAWGGAEL